MPVDGWRPGRESPCKHVATEKLSPLLNTAFSDLSLFVSSSCTQKCVQDGVTEYSIAAERPEPDRHDGLLEFLSLHGLAGHDSFGAVPPPSSSFSLPPTPLSHSLSCLSFPPALTTSIFVM